MKKQVIWLTLALIALGFLYERVYNSKVQSHVEQVLSEDEAAFGGGGVGGGGCGCN